MTVLGLYSCCIVVLLHLPIAFSSTEWTNHGANIFNHRSASSEISARNVGKLALKWKFHTGADVSATASIANGVVYFPSFNGNLYAVDAKTGSAVWEKNLTQLLGEPAVARATPVVAGDLLLVDVLFPPIVVALNCSNAAKIWATPHLDPNPVAILTMSGTVHEGFYYVGVSSAEEALSTNCCSFQGSLQKLKVSTGEIVWRTSMLPDNGGRPGGYAGAAIWGSSPSIDADRRLVFIATGNNYQVPASVVECENHRGNETAGVLEPNPCEDAGNNAESIVAVSLDSGRVVWSKHLGGYDVFSAICYNKTEKPPECAESLGPDFDFGEAPMIIHLKKRGRRTERCIVVAGQKSGFVWALDCDSGDVVWWKQAGPGSALGGAMWGAATNNKLVFTNIVNYKNMEFQLIHPLTSGALQTKGGGWVALDAHTGNIRWAIANPALTRPSPNSTIVGALTFGPVSFSHGLVWTTSFDVAGHVYALDANSGAILWNYSTGATVYAGFSISQSCVYVGNGYGVAASYYGGTNGTYFFAFCLES